MARIPWACIGGLLVAACASIPSVEYRYYLSKSNATVTVTQAVACNTDGTDLIVVTTPTVNTTYSADLRHGVHTLQIRDVEGAFRDFADADVNFSFYDDGRLKSINQSTTGQGEAIIKSGVALSSALIPLVAGAAIAEAKKLDECATIKTFAGDKPATVTYVYPPVGTVDLAALDLPVNLNVAPASAQLYKALNAHGKLPIPKLIISRPLPVGSGARFIPIDSSASEFAYLTLQEMGNVKNRGKEQRWCPNLEHGRCHTAKTNVPLANPKGCTVRRAEILAYVVRGRSDNVGGLFKNRWRGWRSERRNHNNNGSRSRNSHCESSGVKGTSRCHRSTAALSTLPDES
jgi:hypothetical protein